jgi:hypothetical protein
MIPISATSTTQAYAELADGFRPGDPQPGSNRDSLSANRMSIPHHLPPQGAIKRLTHMFLVGIAWAVFLVAVIWIKRPWFEIQASNFVSFTLFDQVAGTSNEFVYHSCVVPFLEGPVSVQSAPENQDGKAALTIDRTVALLHLRCSYLNSPWRQISFLGWEKGIREPTIRFGARAPLFESTGHFKEIWMWRRGINLWVQGHRRDFSLNTQLNVSGHSRPDIRDIKCDRQTIALLAWNQGLSQSNIQMQPWSLCSNRSIGLLPRSISQRSNLLRLRDGLLCESMSILRSTPCLHFFKSIPSSLGSLSGSQSGLLHLFELAPINTSNEAIYQQGSNADPYKPSLTRCYLLKFLGLGTIFMGIIVSWCGGRTLVSRRSGWGLHRRLLIWLPANLLAFICFWHGFTILSSP